ncbi:MAG: type II secretion system F family protein [Phycisphaerales bacterium]|nr:type II secretion system F family protein [Phycisphaerales bacterium]
MPTYRYQSMTAGGLNRSGTLTAASRADAVRQLMQRGETATQVVAADADEKSPRTTSAKPKSTPRIRTGRPSMGKAEMSTFIRELATALEAGLPLMQALRTIRRQATGRAAPVILDFLIERVEAGDTLHKAASEYGRPFNDLVIGMIRASDASGRSAEILHQLADLLERGVELRRELLGAAFYPMIVAVLILASAGILVVYLIPRLLGPIIAADPDAVLPFPTRVVMGLSDFMMNWWMFMLAVIVISFVAIRVWLASPDNRLIFDRTKLQIPVLGRLLRDISVARFTRTLGTLADAGLPILDCLRITRDTLGNAAMMRAIDEVQDQVTAGRPLADPLERSGLFPPLLVQVVHLGERSGRLENMLKHAAGAFDRQVAISLKLFTKAFPPLLIILMAGIGGFVLAAILLPLLQMQSAVG